MPAVTGEQIQTELLKRISGSQYQTWFSSKVVRYAIKPNTPPTPATFVVITKTEFFALFLRKTYSQMLHAVAVSLLGKGSIMLIEVDTTCRDSVQPAGQSRRPVKQTEMKFEGDGK